MVERLSRLDASFLYLEEPGTPMHVGGVLILDAPLGGLNALAALVEDFAELYRGRGDDDRDQWDQE